MGRTGRADSGGVQGGVGQTLVNGERAFRPFIEAMAKHLPPSASTLELLDVGGVAGAILSEGRGDLQVMAVEGSAWGVDDNSADAVVAFDRVIDSAFLAAARRALRPGGRLIAVTSEGEPRPIHVETLENAGFCRILIETAVENDSLAVGVLLRGEKPHTTDDTLERIRVASDQDAAELDMASYRGRYVYLLIKQTPNKPVWAMRSDEAIHWDALCIGEILLAFTSLPKAVNFMQPAVLSGWIHGVNKVAKFQRATVAGWGGRVLLNPALERVAGLDVAYRVVDAGAAEKPDE